MVCAPVRSIIPSLKLGDYLSESKKLAKARGLSIRTGAQTMLYLTCTMISSIDLAHYTVSRAKIGFLWIVIQYVLLLWINLWSDPLLVIEHVFSSHKYKQNIKYA